MKKGNLGGGFSRSQAPEFRKVDPCPSFCFCYVHTSAPCRRHIDETRALTLLELTSQTGR